MACVQTPLFPLALLHQQRKKKTLSISTGQVMSRGGLKFRYFLFHSLKQYFSKTLISSLKSRRYFLRAPQASEGKREADVGGRGTPDTRGLLVARRGNLGPNKEFQDGGQQWFSTAFLVFPSLRFVAIVCLNFQARLSFFRCSTCFLEAYLFYTWVFHIPTVFMLLEAYILYSTRILN